jgi:hypothetical protein
MSTPPILFSVEEAFARLGKMTGAGCLLVFNAQESAHIFVDDGKVVAVKAGDETGEKALRKALGLADSSYRWIPDADPPRRTVSIKIDDFTTGAAATPSLDDRASKTIKIPNASRPQKKLDYQYFFVPEEAPTSRQRLKKSSTIVGREGSCDLRLNNFQVSRRHCLLEVTDRGLLVKDLGSTNGTFVNGISLKDGYINAGDRLGLGTYVMTLRREKVASGDAR